MPSRCPSCQVELNIPDSAIGKVVLCPKCKTKFVAVAAVAPVQTPAPVQAPAQVPSPAPKNEPDNPFAFDVPPPKAEPENVPHWQRQMAKNPQTNPFASETLSEVELQSPSSHAFQIGQFFNRQQAVLIGFVVAVLMLLLFVGLYIGIAIRRGGVPAFFDDGGLIMLIFIVFCFIAAVWTFIYAVRRYAEYPHEVTVDTKGLSWGDQQILWQNLTFVWRSETVSQQGWTSNLIVEADDGTAITLDHSYEDYKVLAAKVQYHGKRQLLPSKLADLGSGDAEFGPLRVSKERLAYELGANDRNAKGSLDWDDLSQWGISNGKLILRTDDKKHVIPLASIPNYEVLLAICATLSNMAQASPEKLESDRVVRRPTL